MGIDTDKVPDPELQRFTASCDSNEVRSVIVELDLGPPQLGPREKVPRPRNQLASPEPVKTGGEDEPMSQLERELLALGLGQDLVRLNAAQAFVVSVSAAQLRALAQLPLVGVIRPNRTHRVPSTSPR